MGYEDGVADYREEGIWDDVELDDIVQIIVYGDDSDARLNKRVEEAGLFARLVRRP